jgi:hypothetical protein
MRPTTPVLAVVLLALASCDAAPTIPAPSGGEARFTICSPDGDCGPTREPPPDTTGTKPGPASYDYNSTAFVYPGALNQQNRIELHTYSTAKLFVATTRLEARFYIGPRCSSSLTQFKYEQKSASGSPVTVESTATTLRWPNEPYEYKVTGLHTFVPVTGGSGGGTFYSTAEVCR